MENCKGLGTTKMYEHECESDEDCEVYFLKPVNEYNIVDKIKEANKELFADDADANTAVTSDEAISMNTYKKVTFATNLEDYEPATELQEDPATFQTVSKTEAVLPTDGIQKKLAADFKFPIIDEEVLNEEEIGEILEEDQQGNVTAKFNNVANTEKQYDNDENDVANNNKSKKNKTHDTEAEVVAEICEEIIIMDMEDGNELQKTSSVENQLRNKIMKQATFDYDESDNKSLTNLLTSDFEEEDDDDYEKLAENDNGDDEDDDQLSIIVASYIPNDFDKDSFVSESNNTQKMAKDKKIYFSKHFSFRRKTGSSKNPTSASSSTASCRHMPPPEVTDLKLNYKTCCEYRNAVQEKLPKYTGYLSEYGLTREQLAKREAKLQRKERFVLEQALKANDQEMRKMQDNERAFITWLKQKMRFPINKTRNMFDVNRLPGCRSESDVRNRNSSGKIK